MAEVETIKNPSRRYVSEEDRWDIQELSAVCGKALWNPKTSEWKRTENAKKFMKGQKCW